MRTLGNKLAGRGGVPVPHDSGSQQGRAAGAFAATAATEADAPATRLGSLWHTALAKDHALVLTGPGCPARRLGRVDLP